MIDLIKSKKIITKKLILIIKDIIDNIVSTRKISL